MPRGTALDLLNALEHRIDELQSGDIESSERVYAADVDYEVERFNGYADVAEQSVHLLGESLENVLFEAIGINDALRNEFAGQVDIFTCPFYYVDGMGEYIVDVHGEYFAISGMDGEYKLTPTDFDPELYL